MDEIIPALSVILTTRGDFDVVRATVRHLAAQTIAGRIELIIVAGSRAQLRPDEATLRGLGRWQIVEAGAVRSVGHGNALGIRAAGASVVALAEDHAFPAPDWAEALLRAHAQPCVAVGPAIYCGNPVNQVSWADLLIGYGPWLAPLKKRRRGSAKRRRGSGLVVCSVASSVALILPDADQPAHGVQSAHVQRFPPPAIRYGAPAHALHEVCLGR